MRFLHSITYHKASEVSLWRHRMRPWIQGGEELHPEGSPGLLASSLANERPLV
jgi:hypothetical protein